MFSFLQSVHIFTRKDTNASNKILESQLANLDNICTEVKEVLLVHSYHDLLSRSFILISIYTFVIICIYVQFLNSYEIFPS